FNIGFFPMHIAGLLGMPRRIYTYGPDMGWNAVNMVTTCGSFLFAFGVLLFLIDVGISLKRGKGSGANPWDAPTLEWATVSPPRPYNFAVIPIVASRHPLWEGRLTKSVTSSSLDKGYILPSGRETLGTTALEAEPAIILEMPGDSYAPFFLGLFTALLFTAMLFCAWALIGFMSAACGLVLVGWLWPAKRGPFQPSQGAISDDELPVGVYGKRSCGWWGLIALVITEGSLFGYLLFSYFYLGAETPEHWPPEGLPRLWMPATNTAILLASSGLVWLSEMALKRGRRFAGLASLALAIAAGVAFVAIQAQEWRGKTYTMTSHLYGSLYFMITGFHMLHVVIGILILLTLWLWSLGGRFRDRDVYGLKIGGFYWHFVDAVWLVIFTTFYLLPYLR
ncbi:MAG: cytochrome c oxidase subunit 3, partial [Pseudomonadota bacterium]|nr:cytochrome c oxidase subunit 3 [Pseudomonadota bacterium]